MERKDKNELIEKLLESLKDCDPDDLLNYAKKYWQTEYKKYSDKDLLIEYRGIYGNEFGEELKEELGKE